MQRKFPVCSKIQQFYTRTFLLVSVFSIRSIYLMCILFILESRQDGASNSTKMQLHDIIAIHICDRIWEKQSVSEKINYHVCTEIVLLEHEDANGNKEKEAPSYSKAKHLDWLQNWMVASSLDVKCDMQGCIQLRPPLFKYPKFAPPPHPTPPPPFQNFCIQPCKAIQFCFSH